MRTPIVAGNWKMNMAVAEATGFVSEIREDLEGITGVEKIIAPPAVSLYALADLLDGGDIMLAAQNMYYEEKGAYTGEISPYMVGEYCSHVIIGHSERRTIFNESDEMVNRKVLAALKHDLTPIVCVGEDLALNEAGSTDSFVANQVRAALAGVAEGQASRLVLAYEPIWAIGTGKACDVDTAQHVIGSVIRNTLTELFGEDTAESIRILYGGSVKPANVASFMEQPDVDGALVGGASLKPTWVELTLNAAKAVAGV
ncbi:MAG: triose-phosphate isomerase [Chloroflexota bacterium]